MYDNSNIAQQERNLLRFWSDFFQYSFHPISVLNTLQQNSIMIRPDLFTNYAASYGISNYMTAPALGPPIPVAMTSKIHALRMDKNGAKT